MLLCLGIDSEFAMIESVMTVIHDANIAPNMSKPMLAALVCGISYLLGLVFVTQSGIYWFTLFDYYSCVVAMYFVTFMEVFWLMWGDEAIFDNFAMLVKTWTGRRINPYYKFMWKYVCPVIIVSLITMAFGSHDLMKAESSKPYPEGSGYLPNWTIHLGWKIGMIPLFAFIATYIVSLERDIDRNTAASDPAHFNNAVTSYTTE
eukprot:CAMPEP_0175634974 /NCGR_PEP_ID=MMETSP0097-20121207/1452_1 /TAXON_ID=311494 /ORGANISM="Alexandrium monilatum, Strain CCMP3105" /LENGTH=203 /DNA_ID=CAMNT_0016940597 /DNA_START=1 /DNA_END=612 /DNA_ORIENTATION=-